MAPLPGLISNQVYEGFAQLNELRAFMEYDVNSISNWLNYLRLPLLPDLLIRPL